MAALAIGVSGEPASRGAATADDAPCCAEYPHASSWISATNVVTSRANYGTGLAS